MNDKDIDIEQVSLFARSIIKNTKVMISSSCFCIKDTIIYQLWYDQYSEYREWRPLKSFEEASEEFKCYVVVEK